MLLTTRYQGSIIHVEYKAKIVISIRLRLNFFFLTMDYGQRSMDFFGCRKSKVEGRKADSLSHLSQLFCPMKLQPMLIAHGLLLKVFSFNG